MFEVKKEILETHEALLTVEIDRETSQKALERVTREISRDIKIPGFRKGRVPLHIIERTVGADALRQEAAEMLLEDIYPQILDEADIQPYSSGRLEKIETRPFIFTIRVPLAPVVNLGDYESLRMEPQPPEVTEEEVQEALEQIRRNNAVLNLVERPAEMGDQLVLSVLEGRIDDEVILHDHNVEVVLDDDAPLFSADFIAALVGMREEEQKTFTASLPEDFVEEDLQGEEVEFEVEVAEVYSRVLPEIDDALASAVGNFETLEELRASVREHLLEHKEMHAEETYREDLVDALVEICEVHFPPELLEAVVDDLIGEISESIEQRYDMKWEAFLRQQGMTEEKFRESLRPRAADRLRRSLVIGAFAEELDVVVTEAEVRQQVDAILRDRGIADETLVAQFKIDSAAGQEVISNVKLEKTLRALERLAQGLPPIEPEPDPEDEQEVWMADETEIAAPEAEPESPEPEDEVAAEEGDTSETDQADDNE